MRRRISSDATSRDGRRVIYSRFNPRLFGIVRDCAEVKIATASRRSVFASAFPSDARCHRDSGLRDVREYITTSRSKWLFGRWREAERRRKRYVVVAESIATQCFASVDVYIVLDSISRARREEKCTTAELARHFLIRDRHRHSLLHSIRANAFRHILK